ncbi:MAG: hypothetical protein FWD89_01460 [Firmicutes bacterium]|nr:hypothetical protein [Bacillota bacterium]
MEKYKRRTPFREKLATAVGWTVLGTIFVASTVGSAFGMAKVYDNDMAKKTDAEYRVLHDREKNNFVKYSETFHPTENANERWEKYNTEEASAARRQVASSNMKKKHGPKWLWVGGVTVAAGMVSGLVGVGAGEAAASATESVADKIARRKAQKAAKAKKPDEPTA